MAKYGYTQTKQTIWGFLGEWDDVLGLSCSPLGVRIGYP